MDYYLQHSNTEIWTINNFIYFHNCPISGHWESNDFPTKLATKLIFLVYHFHFTLIVSLYNLDYYRKPADAHCQEASYILANGPKFPFYLKIRKDAISMYSVEMKIASRKSIKSNKIRRKEN